MRLMRSTGTGAGYIRTNLSGDAAAGFNGPGGGGIDAMIKIENQLADAVVVAGVRVQIRGVGRRRLRTDGRTAGSIT